MQQSCRDFPRHQQSTPHPAVLGTVKNERVVIKRAEDIQSSSAVFLHQTEYFKLFSRLAHTSHATL
jgi:hypothetical protein